MMHKSFYTMLALALFGLVLVGCESSQSTDGDTASGDMPAPVTRADYDDDARYIQESGQYALTQARAAAEAGDMATAQAKYREASEYFQRLTVERPDHPMADHYNVVAGQCLVKAGAPSEAIEAFAPVLAGSTASNEQKAEALYWTGDAYMQLNEFAAAYTAFVQLVDEMPSSRWATFADGRLKDERLFAIGAGG